MREHYRGGQSFYVCPRISDQAKLAEDLQKLVPELEDRRRQRPDAGARARAGHDRLLRPQGRRPAGHQHHRERPRHPDRQHADHPPRRPVRPGPALPAPRPHRPRQGPRLRLLHRPGQPHARRDRRAPPAGHPVAGRPGRGLPAREPRPRHPWCRQPARRGAVGAHPRGRLRALQPHARGGGGSAPRQGEATGRAESTDWTPQITIDAAALMPESYIGDLDLRLSMYRRLASLETRTSSRPSPPS